MDKQLAQLQAGVNIVPQHGRYPFQPAQLLSVGRAAAPDNDNRRASAAGCAPDRLAVLA